MESLLLLLAEDKLSHKFLHELMETRTVRPFSFSFNTSDYRILHMDQDQGRLYLGSREYLVALDMHNINKEPLIGECANFVRLIEPWNRTHLYTCGTGAYKPICTFINRGWRAEKKPYQIASVLDPHFKLAWCNATEKAALTADINDLATKFTSTTQDVPHRKGKCSYDPRQENAVALIRVHVDFMGTDPAIFRTLGDRPAVRTEQYDSRWLNGKLAPDSQIPDSSERNDDKLYFFFREKSLDAAGGGSPSVLARVGRVCLNDDGGQRSLVNKWTTFLKARLVCSVIGSDGVETYFDELKDVFIQPTQDERNPVVYAGSAVCVYSMSDIRNVFNGPFSHKHGHNYQWTPYTGKIPYPRPGTEFSDEAVNFVRAHPLMYHPVYPIHKRPLVVRTGVDYRFTSIVVDLVDAVDGRRSRRQDIKHGNPLRQCRGFNAKVEKRLSETVQFGVEGSSTFLECQPRSPQATVKWLYQKPDGRRKVLSRDGEVLKTGHGILLKSLRHADGGLYHCLATENNFKHTVAHVALRILDREIVEALTSLDGPPEDQNPRHHPHPPPPPPPPHTLPPQFSSQPEIRLINQYCQSYWQQFNPNLPTKRTSRRHVESQPEPALGGPSPS
ncbi:unnamed protein product [Coregonus sp. 'balchen']|nr:unnamed protein product [Coregonus sp. 'balchen']